MILEWHELQWKEQDEIYLLRQCEKLGRCDEELIAAFVDEYDERSRVGKAARLELARREALS